MLQPLIGRGLGATRAGWPICFAVQIRISSLRPRKAVQPMLIAMLACHALQQHFVSSSRLHHRGEIQHACHLESNSDRARKRVFEDRADVCCAGTLLEQLQSGQLAACFSETTCLQACNAAMTIVLLLTKNRQECIPTRQLLSGWNHRTSIRSLLSILEIFLARRS